MFLRMICCNLDRHEKHLFYCRLVRFGQVYSFPVMLSEAVSPSAVFYGSVVPLLAYWSIKVLIINPFKKKEEEEYVVVSNYSCFRVSRKHRLLLKG